MNHDEYNEYNELFKLIDTIHHEINKFEHMIDKTSFEIIDENFDYVYQMIENLSIDQ